MVNHWVKQTDAPHQKVRFLLNQKYLRLRNKPVSIFRSPLIASLP